MFQIAFKSKYRSNYCRLQIALFYRRIVLLFTNYVLSFKFIFASILPPILTYALQRGNPLRTSNLVYLPAIICAIFFFSITFFAHLPFEERKHRLRYLLKMLGADSLTYYFNMIICDFLYLTIILLVNYFLLFAFNFGNYDQKFIQDNHYVILSVFLYNLAWSVSFVTQSYFFQYLVSTTGNSIRMVPYYIMALNIGPLPVLMMLSVLLLIVVSLSGDSFTLNLVYGVFYVFNVISPSLGLGSLIIRLTIIEDSGENEDNSIIDNLLLYPAIFGLVLNPIITFMGAIIMDYSQNRVKSIDSYITNRQ